MQINKAIHNVLLRDQRIDCVQKYILIAFKGRRV